MVPLVLLWWVGGARARRARANRRMCRFVSHSFGAAKERVPTLADRDFIHSSTQVPGLIAYNVTFCFLPGHTWSQGFLNENPFANCMPPQCHLTRPFRRPTPISRRPAIYAWSCRIFQRLSYSTVVSSSAVVETVDVSCRSNGSVTVK
jgi:hypothetical protein